MKGSWKSAIIFLSAVQGLFSEPTHQSMTARSIPYREVCKRASEEDTYFQNFRSIEAYFNAVECGQAGEFAQYIRNHARKKTLAMIPTLNRLDSIGHPVLNEIAGFGKFSGTTLRYILVGDHISRLFKLPKNYTAVEIGAGFGGQSYVLSQLLPFGNYYIYDLPEVELLIQRVASTLKIPNIQCLSLNAPLPESKVDLFISNYAFSECDRGTQLDYFHRVMVKAERGYILFNITNNYDHLSREELIELMKQNGIRPTIHPEPVFSYTGNVLITWDKTNEK